MTVSTRDRFAEVVRSEPVDLTEACLLIASEADPELDVREWQDALDELASAMPRASQGAPAEVQAAALRTYLGEHCGFAGSAADYRDVRSSFLHEVLRRRHGLPILLSVVWLEVARRAGIAAYGIGAPGHFLVGIGPVDAGVVVDPFHGGVLVDSDDIAALVEDATGVPLHTGQLMPSPAHEILQRILTNIRIGAASNSYSVESLRTTLWAVELGLLLPHHPLDLRRVHGEVLVQLGDFVRGAEELETYAEAMAYSDRAAADDADRLARMSRARLN